MAKPLQHSDDEILRACRDLARRGVEPTYRNVRAAGFPACGTRLRRIRDQAVESGTLTLPAGSSIRCRVVHSLLSRRVARQTIPFTLPEINMPKTASEFIKIERRGFLTNREVDRQRLAFKHHSVRVTAGLLQWNFYFVQKPKRPRKPRL